MGVAVTDGTTVAWLQLLALGGAAGSIGQIARSMAGIHKLSGEAQAAGIPRSDLFEPSRLIYSIIVGFAAGSLSAISTVDVGSLISSTHIIGFAAAGYAGTDFIEAFIRQRLPAQTSQPEKKPEPQIPEQQSSVQSQAVPASQSAAAPDEDLG